MVQGWSNRRLCGRGLAGGEVSLSSVRVLRGREPRQQREKGRCVLELSRSGLCECLFLMLSKRSHGQWVSGWAPPSREAHFPLCLCLLRACLWLLAWYLEKQFVWNWRSKLPLKFSPVYSQESWGFKSSTMAKWVRYIWDLSWPLSGLAWGYKVQSRFWDYSVSQRL